MECSVIRVGVSQVHATVRPHRWGIPIRVRPTLGAGVGAGAAGGAGGGVVLGEIVVLALQVHLRDDPALISSEDKVRTTA